MLEGNDKVNTKFAIKNSTDYKLLSLKKTVDATTQQCYLDLQLSGLAVSLETEFVFPLNTLYSIAGGVGDCVKTESNFVCQCDITSTDKYCAIAIQNKLDTNDSCDLGVGYLSIA